MNVFQRGSRYALIVALLVGGCGDAPAPLNERLQTLDTDLQLGASGEQVRTLNDYLTRFGYFPNAALAQQYPAWRPLVAEPPADGAVFDERTELVIRHLQAGMSLPVTGVVDAATRQVLKTARCGVPEGIPNGRLLLRRRLDYRQRRWWGRRYDLMVRSCASRSSICAAREAIHVPRRIGPCGASATPESRNRRAMNTGAGPSRSEAGVGPAAAASRSNGQGA